MPELRAGKLRPRAGREPHLRRRPGSASGPRRSSTPSAARGPRDVLRPRAARGRAPGASRGHRRRRPRGRAALRRARPPHRARPAARSRTTPRGRSRRSRDSASGRGAGGRRGAIARPGPRLWPPRSGSRLAGWTPDTHDWRGDRPRRCSTRPAPGSAPARWSLAHDGARARARARRAARETVRLVGPLGAERCARSGCRDLLGAASSVAAATPRSARARRRRRRGAAERDRAPGASRPTRSAGARRRTGALDPAARARGRVGGSSARWPRADGSVGRILDGHLNARRAARRAAPSRCATRARRRRRGGGCAWGVGRRPGARRGRAGAAPRRRASRCEGVKTFCSGAGGLDARARAGAARAGDGPPLLGLRRPARRALEIDRDVVPRLRACARPRATAWLPRCAGARASSASRASSPREPWFAPRRAAHRRAPGPGSPTRPRDAALAVLAAGARAATSWRALAAGRIATARGTIDLWLAEAAARADADPERPLRALRVHAARRRRAGRRARSLDEAARAAGSRPFATGGALDRAAPRPATLFLLQHRLDPLRRPAGARGGWVSAAARAAERATSRRSTRADPDPWDFATERLRARRSTRRTLAALGEPALRPRRSRSAARSACSPSALAARCDALVAVDVAQRGGRRRARAPGRRAAASTCRARVDCPRSCPAGPFDLVVCSEVLYYFDARPLLERCSPAWSARLAPGGLLLAVHWRPATRDLPAAAATRSTPCLRARAGPAPAAGIATAAYLLDVAGRAEPA